MVRILVVDDSATFRATIGAMLRSALGPSLELVEAADATEAIVAFMRSAPDVTFLDILLKGGQSGLALIGQMLDRRPSARIVVCSILARDDDEARAAVRRGAVAHLVKPIDRESIMVALRQAGVNPSTR